MAEAGAMVDVVGPEHRADELLEQVIILIRAFGRAEPGQRLRSVLPLNLEEALCRQIQGLVPGGFTETLARIGIALWPFRIVGFSNQRHSQARGVNGGVEAVAP